MRKPQLMAVMTIAVILVMITGCATISSGPTPREQVAAAITDLQAALKAHDIEKIMGFYSDDFTDSQGANKAAARGMFENLQSQGILQDIAIAGLDKSEITVEGDSATVTPLIVNLPSGQITYGCTLKKEADGVWRLTSADQIY
jgi:ketosteroid isomerase-like protein